MGSRLLSLRNPDNRWRGLTTLNAVDRGERKFLRIENGYVSPDGTEIRQWPGSFTMLDLSPENNDYGYDRYITDVVLPIFQTTPGATYQFESVPPYPSKQTLNSRARAKHWHCFAQIQGQVFIIGESRFRESPIYDNNRIPLTITQVEDAGGNIKLTLSGTPGAHTAADSSAPSLNGLTQYQVVFCEDVVLTAPAGVEQALVDAKLNRNVHEIQAIAGATVTLSTAALGLAAARAATGQIHVVPFNRSNTYDNTNGQTPYAAAPENRIDDATSLTSWRVIETPSKGSSVKDCLPAWVANRQRDVGDVRVAGAPIEGVWLDAFGRRGVSRRETLELPYRVNPEPATDRLLLAAPGYGCLFQVPVKIPADPSGDRGVEYFANDDHDKPRALGIPKARALECYFKVAPVSAAENGTLGKDFNVFAITADPAQGLPAGEYKFAISYADDGTGEEGLASETITVTIPSTVGVAYTILIGYVHPGYVMPECLANRLNIYLALPGQDDLAFYCSVPLQQRPIVAATTNGTNGDVSGKYGFRVAAAGTEEEWRTIQMPLPGDTNDIASQLDPERLAPQSAAMPRGADAVRYVRGVLLSGGHLGNVGSALQLWASFASGYYGFDVFNQVDQMVIRAHGNDMAVPSATMDGDLTTHALGVAGRCFPSAYQGVDLIQRDLLPGRTRHQVDRVLNRMGEVLSGANAKYLHYERIRLTRPVWDRIRDAGTSPTSTLIQRDEKEVFYVEPRGQLQVGDPGAPNRASPLFIQFIDPNRGDDLVAIGSLSGRGICCTREETYVFAWARNPGTEVPQTLTDEFGCVAANSMVEFDGGLAWMSHRGPVAIGGAGPQHVGLDVEGLFLGRERRYQFDSRGMMRHCWGAHDQERGLVMWGLVTKTSTHELEREFLSFNFDQATDELRSRFPCDEVLWWSYRTNTFGTWRPPAGREILWMAPIRSADGHVWMCYLAADGRIYALDDASHDTGHAELSIEVVMATRGTATTDVTFTYTSGQDGDAVTGRDGNRLHLRAGMVVEVLNKLDELVLTTTIAEITTTGTSTAIVLAAAVTWDSGYRMRIGPRQRMTIVSTFLGAETKDKLNVSGVQVRYTLFGDGKANFIASLLTTDLDSGGLQAREVEISDSSKWTPMGDAQGAQQADGFRVGRRRNANKGGSGSPETAVKLVFTGASQVRIADISLEVA